jgi:hypothetical protein
MISLKSKLMSLGFLAFSFSAFAQDAPENWFNLDLGTDKVHGVSTEKAYKELLKDKKPKKMVLVAHINIKCRSAIWCSCWSDCSTSAYSSNTQI